MASGSATVAVVVSLTTSGQGTKRTASAGKAKRGTSNSNERGNTTQRRNRKRRLIERYRADFDVLLAEHRYPNGTAGLGWFNRGPIGTGLPACRCYRCGTLLTYHTVTIDRIIPGCLGGTYEDNNIRPACGYCNSSTGAKLARRGKEKAA